MKVLLAQINPVVGDLCGNCQKILKIIENAKKLSVKLVIFSELALTGYPPQDLLKLPLFLDETEKYLKKIIDVSSSITVVLGTPRKENQLLYNSAAIIENKKLLGYQDKACLSKKELFNERRYFEQAKEIKLWNICDHQVAITICHEPEGSFEGTQNNVYHKDLIKQLTQLKPDFLINLSACHFSKGTIKKRIENFAKIAQKVQCPLFLCNQVGANDMLIFDGHSLFINSQGEIQAIGKGFLEDALLIEMTSPKSIPQVYNRPNIESLYEALILGIKDYFGKLGFSKACLGLSGGIDSAVVAVLAKEALGSENILAVMMPSRYSSKESLIDATLLAKNLGIETKEISIEKPFETYLNLLNPLFEGLEPNVTEENLQSRIRGMILMALSNKFGHVVLATGNKSELAMGYATLYGDMCGGVAVIGDVLKSEVYQIADWINRKQEVIPQNILIKPPSAELKPHQKDSDSLPPYEILDTIITSYLEENRPSQEIAIACNCLQSLVEKTIQTIEKNEYKRKQAAPSLQVSKTSFSLERHFPLVQKWKQ